MLTRLEPKSSEYRIEKPDCANEFEIHAELFCGLKRLGFDVRGEITWRQATKLKNITRREQCRFDCVIFEGGEAVEIVEIKSAPIRHKYGVGATRQGQRYRRYGIPVTFVYGREGAREFLAQKAGPTWGDA